MRENQVKRKCVICKEDRRTTVHPDEEYIYVCGVCLRDEGKKLLLQTTTSSKGYWKALGLVIVLLIIGILMGKYIL